LTTSLVSASYSVVVIDRELTGRPLIENASETEPYSKLCGGSPCTNVLNPAWIPFTENQANTENGGLFLRLATPGCYPTIIGMVPAIRHTEGLKYPRPTAANVLFDGPPGNELANGDDPRATSRPNTKTWYVTYQMNTGSSSKPTRRTVVSSSQTPANISSWKRFPETMFDVDDCGTALWFPDDGEDGSVGKAYAVATFGMLRGGNISLVSSQDGLKTWQDEGVFLRTRPDKWDSRTLSSGPAPVKLADGNWLFLYNVDNLWPVDHPLPLPSFGRCALGWAILDNTNLTNVLARAEEPLVYAQLPWELRGSTNKVVYTDGIRAEGNDTFTVFAGGADTVVEAFRIQVRTA